ncbi:dynein heavy chain at 16F [Lycorma delicatula]|uniref:dynein heavy chain at 16F n=1 Tax=Lycorma delicatula TaxID=130591 RepID=UPI003F5116A3
MDDQLEYCKELYDVVEEFSIPVASEDIANYYGLADILTNLHNTVETVTNQREKIIGNFNEQINRDIDLLMEEVGLLRDESLKPWLTDIDSNVDEVKGKISQLMEQLTECQQRAIQYRAYQKAFKVEVTRFDLLDEVINDVKLRQLLWESVEVWDQNVHDWTHQDFNTLNPDDMYQTTAKFMKNVNQFEKGLPENKIVPKLKSSVELMKDKLPVITTLRNPNMKPRHWMKVEEVLNYKFQPTETKTLKLLEDVDAFLLPTELQEISGQASSEASLEGLLHKVEDAWKALEFSLVTHRDAKDVFILAGLDEVQTVLDESNINISTIASSRHVGPIKTRVEDWASKLELFSKTLDEWMNCQTNWLYLESIFSAPDIQRQLPMESKLFMTVDKSWKQIMRRTAQNPLAMTACTYPGLLETFQNNNSLLDQILKCLEAYLETKRVVFPRFYFLSNDELIEILAQTRNPHAVQPHLRKCFDAIARLEFGVKISDEKEHKDSQNLTKDKKTGSELLTTDIIAMISPENEKVLLGKGLKARGNVEIWLGKVEEAMFFQLHKQMKYSLADYKTKPRTEWILLHPSQIILTVSQTMWCSDVHTVFSHDTLQKVNKALIAFEKKCFKDLNDLAAMVRGDLHKLKRMILGSLITVDVHARDIITSMVQNKVNSSEHFEWLKQLRYYWETDIDNCVARMSNARYLYGFEYLGASPRLVITPLTDKCYLCLMGALQLDLGGAPAGPAGTGKTETTKDLAKSLAVQCVVFNCSEGLDFKMMGRFFSGLAQSGAWCCFDEFNRIDIEVLSVIAQQLITIRNAKVARATKFMFEGREIKLVMTCAAFITMNPGYAGRTELPDNLKSLFRPMAMMVPDYGLIAEVILYSEGFESSKPLAKKMVNMYKLCSEQLSQQDHYDFGMRAVKSVLVMAGSLKRENPNISENIVLIRALRDSNLPKFLSDDAILFQGILNDLFPGIILPEQDYGMLQKSIDTVIIEHSLQPERCTSVKVIQLLETMIVRHGVMTVGPTGGGKTTVLNVLKWALTQLHTASVEGPYYRPVQTYTINPKSVTMGELYGEVNLMTLEWKDGLLGKFVRIAVQCTEEVHQWVVCDGPVDAVWIENMNTVLDDNKMLCLANSERIKLTPWVHMLFEVQDLAQASPATVSRCGMVYIDPAELKYMPYVKTWLKKITDETLRISNDFKTYIIELFANYVENGLSFIHKNCFYAIHQVDISKVSMLCSLMESLLTEPGVIDKNLDKSRLKTLICQIFIFSYLWALGGNLIDESQEKFDHFVNEQFEEHPDAHLTPNSDFWLLYFNTKDKVLEPWIRIVPPFKYNPEIPFFEMLVPTIDTVRFGFIMEKLLSVNHPVMYTGITGVGKSVVAKTVINHLQESGKWVPVTLNFSAQTSSFRTQEILESKLEKKKKTTLGAPAGKKVVLFIDDVNMPKLETYGAQPPIELLRQYLDFKGLYDRDKLFWKEINDVVVCAACAPPGGGRNPLTPRFVRHFGMLLIPSPNESTLKVIFGAIMKGFLSDFSRQISDIAGQIVNAAVDIYQRIAIDLLPTPAKSHYVFNLRDLSKCIQGVLQADSGTMREVLEIQRLFYHECLRVFHDRLINLEDKSYFYRLMNEICQRIFGTPVILLPAEQIIKDPPMLLFGDFGKPVAKEERIYEEMKDLEKLKQVLYEFLLDYNLLTAKEMKLILFMDAVEHAIRISRILRAERGNGLLVGVGGMGKQNITRLSSHVNGYKCFQIELTRSYDYNSFHEDLRKLYFNAGANKIDTVFLFVDTQIVVEEFLEDINNILNSGEVPNLFEADEYEKVVCACRPAAKEIGIAESNRDGIFDFFISRVRTKLHVVITMSPVGDAFRRRCRMFPSLVNCCTIDWFLPWPEEALLSVAEDALRPISGTDLVSPMTAMCYMMHNSVEKMTERFYSEMRRRYYVTPTSYLELLKLYISLLSKKQEEKKKVKDRIQNGLKKLLETNDLVATMKVQLTEMAPVLKEKSEATAELMKFLVKEKAQADEVRKVVSEEEAVVKDKAEETQSLADDAQRDLDMALPAMEAATKALEALNKNDINELRVFNKPPNLVKFVMEAVCLLFGSKGDWQSAKIVLGDINFLKKLQEYDKDHIPDSLLRKLKDFIDHPEFLPDIVATQSKVCKSICMWVRAIDTYAKVYRVVEPKRKKVEAAEKELAGVMAILRQKQQMLADVEAQIAKLEAQYDSSIAEKAALEATMEQCSARLNRSGRLTMALGNEQVRWDQTVKTMTEEIIYLIGDVLIAAGSVAYLGAFTSSYREELTIMWVELCKELKIPSSPIFSLINVLADAYEIRMWNSFGLPRDNISTENAILVTQAGRWPLMIDPQEQANRWIRNMEGTKELKVVKLTDSNFLRILESAIRIGCPVLLEEVGEKLDPTLRPILLRQVFVQGGRALIRLGDSDVEYDLNFRLYITTKLANPHYLPEICIQVTLVNFTVTPTGVEDQLLADVVRLERPDLEKQRNELIVSINSDKAQLKGIEDKILKLLFTSKGNILDDEELIETLNESKETSSAIANRLMEAEETEVKISAAREKYRTVAVRGSCLYFVVSQLAEVDPMYQFSLKYFNLIFNSVIVTSKKSSDLAERLKILLDQITVAVYTNVSRGLFERHKLVFSFMLCASIYKESGDITEAQWAFLIRGPRGSKAAFPKKPDVATLSETQWFSVNYLSATFPNFKKLPGCVTKKILLKFSTMEEVINININNKEDCEINWNENLTLFERMMVLKALKEEKLVFAITEYVKELMGQAFVESPVISLHNIFQDTSHITPLVFVLSTGSDPVGGFLRFAAETGNTDKIQSISLGQGQGPIAETMIKAAVKKGDWVFLQNCHLASSWMLAMERLVIKLIQDPTEVHPDFRLFLSSMPSRKFPVSVLQNSVKVTNEPPKGLRSNIKRAFLEIQENYFEDHPLQASWRKMVFGICFFHAVIQERKKFGPLGWNILYEFNDSDRECALLNLQLFCNDDYVIPWDALEYTTGEITYGGRVTDYWDQRTLKTILKGFFSPIILRPGYKYSESGTYHCPESDDCCTLEGYRNFVEQLPIIEEPEIFGMHDNANIAFQTNETANVINTILEVQPKESAGVEGKSSDEIVYELAEVIIGKIIKKINEDDAHPSLLKRDSKSRLPSLTTVLKQEIDRFNGLLKVVHSSLNDLKKAIKGFIVMSDALEEMYTSFINQQVPKMWAAKAYPSLKPLGSWVRDLELRLDFIETWLKYGPPPSFWLSGFFFPQGFMTGSLQTHARKYNFPIDQLIVDFIVMKVTLDQEEIENQHKTTGGEVISAYGNIKIPEDGLLVHGLFLDASRFDIIKGILTDANPGELNPPLPVMHLIPVTELVDIDKRYTCPLYKTATRAGTLSTTGHSTNFVVPVLLPTDKSPDYWILRGTALLTAINE